MVAGRISFGGSGGGAGEAAPARLEEVAIDAAAYSIQSDDNRKLLRFSEAAVVTLSGGVTVGTEVVLYAANDGGLTLQPGGGALATGIGSGLFRKNAEIRALVVDTDKWSVMATGMIEPAELTGGVISEPGDGYRYHTFTADGTLTVVAPGTVEALIVGGGGGGGSTSGNYQAGGGGGGGQVIETSLTLATGEEHLVTIGAGGAATTNGGSTVLGALATGSRSPSGQRRTDSGLGWQRSPSTTTSWPRLGCSPTTKRVLC